MSERIALVAALATLVLLLTGIVAWRRRTPATLKSPRGGRRILLPFTGSIDATVLNAAIRIAHAKDATLVAAYLLVVPLEYAEDSTLNDQVTLAMRFSKRLSTPPCVPASPSTLA